MRDFSFYFNLMKEVTGLHCMPVEFFNHWIEQGLKNYLTLT